MAFSFFSKTKVYSLRKSRQVFKVTNKLYQAKGKDLSERNFFEMEKLLKDLDLALFQKDKEKASACAQELEEFCKTHFPKTVFTVGKELFTAVLFAFLVAIVVRQVWFEPYEIPSGSMRPTFKEKDHLTVTKTAFGINFPFQTGHLYFDPSLIKRGGILIFSSDGIDFLDENTPYFWIFSYKKRVIKRLIGKPGDTLYFYGGKIYGIDKDGNDLKELRDPKWMQDLEFIPYIHFDGRKEFVTGTETFPPYIRFYQMNEAIGRLLFPEPSKMEGEVLKGKSWQKDEPFLAEYPHSFPVTYGDFFGMGNFGMSRLLTKEEVIKFTDQNLQGIEEGILYLDIRHDPNLTYPSPQFVPKGFDRFDIVLTPYHSVLPLKEEHLNALMDAMYTARFVIQDGRARRYSMINENQPRGTEPLFKGVPDGIYEFYHGKAYSVNRFGITTALPKDHPLYKKTKENIQKLYNLGIEFSTNFSPYSSTQTTFPNRYAYFREGDLMLLGSNVLKKEDPILKNFQAREMQKLAKGTEKEPYIPFIDHGPPILNQGELDKEFIKKFGIQVPDKKYLVLGDNHAMSGDSRMFGFLPEKNIQGAPKWIVWPPGNRIGSPAQTPYPWMNVPRAIIWAIAACIILATCLWHRKKRQYPMFHPIKKRKNGAKKELNQKL